MANLVWICILLSAQTRNSLPEVIEQVHKFLCELYSHPTLRLNHSILSQSADFYAKKSIRMNCITSSIEKKQSEWNLTFQILNIFFSFIFIFLFSSTQKTPKITIFFINDMNSIHHERRNINLQMYDPYLKNIHKHSIFYTAFEKEFILLYWLLFKWKKENCFKFILFINLKLIWLCLYKSIYVSQKFSFHFCFCFFPTLL